MTWSSDHETRNFGKILKITDFRQNTQFQGKHFPLSHIRNFGIFGKGRIRRIGIASELDDILIFSFLPPPSDHGHTGGSFWVTMDIQGGHFMSEEIEGGHSGRRGDLGGYFVASYLTPLTLPPTSPILILHPFTHPPT